MQFSWRLSQGVGDVWLVELQLLIQTVGTQKSGLGIPALPVLYLL